MKLNFYGATDVGRLRKRNEDNFLIMQEYSLFAIADGMGGHLAGDIASKVCLDSVRGYIETTNIEDMKMLFNKVKQYFYRKSFYEFLLYSISKYANEKVYNLSIKEPNFSGMGTTLIITSFQKNYIYIAHIGDSRLYRIRNKKIRLLTEDHSLVNEYIKLGILKKRESSAFPYKNIVLRSIGLKSLPEIDIFKRKVLKDDIYLLCTDGLTDILSDRNILNILMEMKSLKDGCEKLINCANEKGGPDNITTILISIK